MYEDYEWCEIDIVMLMLTACFCVFISGK